MWAVQYVGGDLCECGLSVGGNTWTETRGPRISYCKGPHELLVRTCTEALDFECQEVLKKSKHLKFTIFRPLDLQKLFNLLPSEKKTI